MKRKIAYACLLLLSAGAITIKGLENRSNVNLLLLQNTEAVAQTEGGNSWHLGTELGTKSVIVGYRTIMSPTGLFPIQVPVYGSISCCVSSERMNACDSFRTDTRC